MSVAVLIGEGPNVIEVACLFFPSMEAAKEKLLPILGKPNVSSKDQVRWWSDMRQDANIDQLSDSASSFYKNFFLCYDRSDGDCYGFTLKEVEYGTPFLSWDLDTHSLTSVIVKPDELTKGKQMIDFLKANANDIGGWVIVVMMALVLFQDKGTIHKYKNWCMTLPDRWSLVMVLGMVGFIFGGLVSTFHLLRLCKPYVDADILMCVSWFLAIIMCIAWSPTKEQTLNEASTTELWKVLRAKSLHITEKVQEREPSGDYMNDDVLPEEFWIVKSRLRRQYDADLARYD